MLNSYLMRVCQEYYDRPNRTEVCKKNLGRPRCLRFGLAYGCNASMACVIRRPTGLRYSAVRARGCPRGDFEEKPRLHRYTSWGFRVCGNFTVFIQKKNTQTNMHSGVYLLCIRTKELATFVNEGIEENEWMCSYDMFIWVTTEF